jgi:hypothetical protein
MEANGWVKLCVLAGCLMFSLSAHAYVDPNAGGMLFQLLAPVFAALVGGWLFLRRWMAAWLRTLWDRLRGKRSEP